MKQARNAHAAGDVETSIRVHDEKKQSLAAQENHGGAGAEMIKSIVYGGLDGIVTSFAIIASVYGANMSAAVVLISGFSKLVGDALSMGLGDAISEHAEQRYIKGERQREQLEYTNMPEEEIEEMVRIYEKKGFTREEASEVMRLMTKKPEYTNYFIDHMMIQELDLVVPDEGDNPLKNGAVSFISFVIFGAIPLIPYIFFYISDYDNKGGQFGIACAFTVVTLFMLGVSQALLIRQPWLKQGLLMILNGSLAAASAFLIGWGIQEGVGLGSSAHCV